MLSSSRVQCMHLGVHMQRLNNACVLKWTFSFQTMQVTFPLVAVLCSYVKRSSFVASHL